MTSLEANFCFFSSTTEIAIFDHQREVMKWVRYVKDAVMIWLEFAHKMISLLSTVG